MARIVSNFFISMDGVVERPDQWHFPYFDDEMGQIVGSGMQSATAMLMGRTLYGEWSQYWPPRPTTCPSPPTSTASPKYVLSHEDFEPVWQNTTVLSGPDDATVKRRCRRSRTAPTATSPCPAPPPPSAGPPQGLLDELALLVHPIAVGAGAAPLRGHRYGAAELLESRTLSTGVMLVRYAPAVA